jgi:hypothetical protein
MSIWSSSWTVNQRRVWEHLVDDPSTAFPQAMLVDYVRVYDRPR